MADGVVVIRQFWPFRVDDAIEVHDAKVGFGNFLRGSDEHFGRVPALIGWVRVGEEAADVGQSGGAEQCVGDCVKQHIGVAVTDKLSVVRNVDPA
jgi:hypothetical protein